MDVLRAGLKKKFELIIETQRNKIPRADENTAASREVKK